MNRITPIVVAITMLATLGCGGSPTAPAPVPTPEPVVTTTPAPPPPPPAPQPPPAPPATSVEQWRATVTSAQWYTTAPIPSSFDVTIEGSTIQFGPLRATILIRDERSIFARPDGMNLQIMLESGTWSLSGQPGIAQGTLTAGTD